MEQSNEKKQTAMMQAMSKFAAHKEKATTFRDVIYLDGVLAILETLLEVERQQIETAFGWGMVNIIELLKDNLKYVDMVETDKEIEKFKNGEPDEKSKHYFTQTFKSE